MTIDETIKHAEEIADEKWEEACNLYKANKAENLEETRECIECVKAHHQLAEWLKELKQLREIPDKLLPKYRDGIQDEYDRGANEMLKEVIDDIRKYIEEVNADADSN